MKRLETLRKEARKVLDQEYRWEPVNGVDRMEIARAMDKLGTRRKFSVEPEHGRKERHEASNRWTHRRTSPRHSRSQEQRHHGYWSHKTDGVWCKNQVEPSPASRSTQKATASASHATPSWSCA